MRHRKAGRKLGMSPSARKAMFHNMVTSLMLHGQIRTTEARAKELRRYADRVISLGKRAPTVAAVDALKGDARQQAQAVRVAAIRRARRIVADPDALEKVFGEYAERFATRPGGYTRVVKLGRRTGDSSPMAVIQLVERWDPSAKQTAAAPEVEVPVDFDDDDEAATVVVDRVQPEAAAEE